jgi:hypothetical protein
MKELLEKEHVEGAKDTFGDSPYERVMDNYGNFDPKLYGMKDNQAFIGELADKVQLKQLVILIFVMS